MSRVLILFLFFPFFSYSQDAIYRKRIDLSVLLTDNVFEEAQQKNIKSDSVLINFIVNENCKIESLEIEKEGNLKSYVKEINYQKQKLIKLIEEQIDCEWVKRQGVKKIKYSYPIIFHLK